MLRRTFRIDVTDEIIKKYAEENGIDVSKMSPRWFGEVADNFDTYIANYYNELLEDAIGSAGDMYDVNDVDMRRAEAFCKWLERRLDTSIEGIETKSSVSISGEKDALVAFEIVEIEKNSTHIATYSIVVNRSDLNDDQIQFESLIKTAMFI